MFDLNRSPSVCSTSCAHEDEDMNALHDAWVSLDETNVYITSDSVNSDAHTSESSSDNDPMDSDNVNQMNIDLVKYPDARLFMPTGYFAFNKACYQLMVGDILGIHKISLQALRDANDGVILDLRSWKRMKQGIVLMGDEELYLKDSPNVRIPFIEEWVEIVANAHVKMGHLSLKDTLQEIKKGWSIDTRYHGLSRVYVKACIDACGCQNIQRATPVDMQHHTSSAPNEEFVVEESMLREVLDDIQVKYSTCLKKCYTNAKYLESYICHRGGESRRGSKCIRRCKTTKRCGCTFRVNVRRLIGDRNQLSISVYDQHSGHDPSAPHEVYHLKVHPNVIKCCMDDLFDIGCARHVARISIRPK